MEQFIYERPREKLRRQGVGALTRIELLQLLIGSGTARYHSAKLAREIEGVMRSQHVSFDALVAIPGIGEAKACQILAALEFGGRQALYE